MVVRLALPDERRRFNRNNPAYQPAPPRGATCRRSADRAAHPLHAGLLRTPVARDAAAQRQPPHWSLDNYRQLTQDQRLLPGLLRPRCASHSSSLSGHCCWAIRSPSRCPPARGPAASSWSSFCCRSGPVCWCAAMPGWYLLGRHGLINEALAAAGLIDAPLKLLNTSIAVHIAMIHILLPYMILPIASALRQIDPALAARRRRAGSGAVARCSARWCCRCRCPASRPACCWYSCCRWASTSHRRWSAGHATCCCRMLIAQQVDLINWPYAACLSATLAGGDIGHCSPLFQRLPGVRSVLRSATR